MDRTALSRSEADEDHVDGYIDRLCRSSILQSLKDRTHLHKMGKLSAILYSSGPYSWITKEPQSDIIIIRPPDSYTINSVIRTIDWFIENIKWRQSIIGYGFNHISQLIDWLSETRPGQLAVGLFRYLNPPKQGEEYSTKD